MDLERILQRTVAVGALLTAPYLTGCTVQSKVANTSDGSETTYSLGLRADVAAYFTKKTTPTDCGDKGSGKKGDTYLIDNSIHNESSKPKLKPKPGATPTAPAGNSSPKSTQSAAATITNGAVTVNGDNNIVNSIHEHYEGTQGTRADERGPLLPERQFGVAYAPPLAGATLVQVAPYPFYGGGLSLSYTRIDGKFGPNCRVPNYHPRRPCRPKHGC